MAMRRGPVELAPVEEKAKTPRLDIDGNPILDDGDEQTPFVAWSRLHDPEPVALRLQRVPRLVLQPLTISKLPTMTTTKL